MVVVPLFLPIDVLLVVGTTWNNSVQHTAKKSQRQKVQKPHKGTKGTNTYISQEARLENNQNRKKIKKS